MSIWKLYSKVASNIIKERELSVLEIGDKVIKWKFWLWVGKRGLHLPSSCRKYCRIRFLRNGRHRTAIHSGHEQWETSGSLLQQPSPRGLPQEGKRGRVGSRHMDEISDFQTVKPVSFPGKALVIKGEVNENCFPHGMLLLKTPTGQNRICKNILIKFNPKRVAVEMLTACSCLAIKSRNSQSYFPTSHLKKKDQWGNE